MEPHKHAHEQLRREVEHLFQKGDPSSALSLFKQLRDNSPEDPEIASEFLFLLHFARTAPEALFLEHRRFARRFEPRGFVPMKAWPHKRTGKIRIGYLSPDIYGQASHYVLAPLLRGHNKRHFEIFVYATHPARDSYTEEIAGYADAWRLIGHKEYAAIRAAARHDEIDILVDLAGHSGINSMPAFAERAAPIQISWFGYMDTTGLANIDYRFTDEMRVPKGRDNFYSEHLFYLPNSYSFSPHENACDFSRTRDTNDIVTFGSLNTPHKINKEVLETWATLLQKVPTSRLLFLACPDKKYSEWLRNFFASYGVDPFRVEPRPRQEMSQFLKTVSEIDVALDPFPYTGGITTYHALSVGIPTVTLEGTTEYERNCAAIMREAGLPDWIVHTKEEYIAKAAAFGAAHELRKNLRATLPRELVARSGAFVHDVEEAYQVMFQKSHLT